MLALAAPVLLVIGCNKTEEPKTTATFDEKAIQQFSALLKDGMPAMEKKEAAEMVERCFPKGLPFAKVAEILETARHKTPVEMQDRGPTKGADMVYDWVWENGGGDSAVIHVYVGYDGEGNRVILYAFMAYLPS